MPDYEQVQTALMEIKHSDFAMIRDVHLWLAEGGVFGCRLSVGGERQKVEETSARTIREAIESALNKARAL